ncbi:IS1595 family transposase [Intestinibacter sp.]|uniref:IS1595 family transposase n=1 Tax=Intestinibacter sp. TaxID=1965304 RepID=UPI003FA5C7B4
MSSLIALAQQKLKNLYNLGFYDQKEGKDEILEGRFNKGLKCPKCGYSELNKNGKTYGRQRYICKKCRRTFDERSLSPLSNTKLSLEKWLKYCQFMIEGGTIRMCAEEVGVSVPTAFFMRHKILDVINVYLKDETLEGIVETDACYINESFKGSPAYMHFDEKYFKNFNKSRVSCLGVHFNKTPGMIPSYNNIKESQICINTAIDKKGHILTRIVDNDFGKSNNKIKSKDMVSFFEGKVEKDVTLCVYSWKYREVARKLNLKLVKVFGQYNPIYNVKRVFKYNRELREWMRNFNGVATKYLNNYLTWFKFLFISKKYKEFNRIKELFMELATRDLYITQYMIKNRFVESL